ncbi:MAG: hypothetical protein LQ352_006099 [Teloschistes flavicans]|nr:MAG: hypothetical protein LQ352_006099 [Teloschistes flavicans]
MEANDHLALELLRKAHPPQTASTIFTEKVLHKPLHLRPTSPDPNSQDARARRRLQRLRKKEKSRRRQKPKSLSAKEKRVTGIYDVPKDLQKHHIYVPLYRMWIRYIWDILGMVKGEAHWVTAQGAGTKLTSADFHGAKVMVVRSKCVSMVGLRGIVLRDTKFTFQIITQQNELKMIPKNHTIFRIQIPQPDAVEEDPTPKLDKDLGEEEMGVNALIFELHGSSFEHRAIDRATKKFKQRNIVEL